MQASDIGVPARDEMEVAACPRCGSSEGTTVVEGRDYLYGVDGCFFGWQCAGCGLQYQNPRPTADRLVELYPSYYGPHVANPSALEAKPVQEAGRKERLKQRWYASRAFERLGYWRARLRWWHRRTGIGFFRPTPVDIQFFLRQMGYTHLKSLALLAGPFLPRAIVRECHRMMGIQLVPHYVAGGRLLEIGCATGNQLQAYREQGWVHLDGIEFSEQAATQARQRGFPIVCEQVEVALDRFSDECFDVIVSSMVLEHLYDPFTVVRTIARKLKPGGEFLFSTITRDALDARLFGKYWSGYDFPRHMVYLRMADIQEMLSKDFDQVEFFHQNAPVDFLRPATWRRPENRLSDRLIARLAKAPIGLHIGEVLARRGQTCRVSFRCRRK